MMDDRVMCIVYKALMINLYENLARRNQNPILRHAIVMTCHDHIDISHGTRIEMFG